MQIRTGLTLAAGVGIGIFVGMGVSREAKERIANIVKRRLVMALTGEDWRPKNPIKPKKPVNYKVKYTNDDLEQNKIDEWEQCLHFKSSEDAWDFVYQMYKKCEKSSLHVVSVFELCRERGYFLDYTWDNYGWTQNEVKNDWKVVCVNYDPLKSEYKIMTPKLHVI